MRGSNRILPVGIMKAMPKTPNYFAEKTIVITGAGSGIGRATALIFAREGTYVVCADINEKGASETAAEVSRKDSKALAIKVDVTKRSKSMTWPNGQSQLSAPGGNGAKALGARKRVSVCWSRRRSR